MTMDPVIENAQQAANTPANQAPDERAAAQQQDPEQRRRELNHDGIWSTDPKKQAAARAELQRLMRSPDAAEDQKKQTEDAALSPAARRVQKANQDPALFNPKDARHEEARRELRLALADAATNDERQAWENTPLKEKREVYGLQAPQLPADWAEVYHTEYGGHEGSFIGLARAEGLSGHQVRGLRDEAIQLGQLVAESGKPATDEALKALWSRAWFVKTAGRRGHDMNSHAVAQVNRLARHLAAIRPKRGTKLLDRWDALVDRTADALIAVARVRGLRTRFNRIALGLGR